MKTVSRRDAVRALASGGVIFGATGAVGLGAETTQSADRMQMRVDHYTTAQKNELVSSIVLAHRPYRYTTLYSLKLPQLSKGDVVQAHCQFEVTNDLGFNVMLAHAMTLTSEESIVAHGDKPGGQLLAEYAGENVSPAMHHGFRTLMGSQAVSEDGDAWVSVVIYVASTAAKPGNEIKVEKGYGGLRAVVYRNAVNRTLQR